MGTKMDNNKNESLGPGPPGYTLKLLNSAPMCSFGSRFDSDIRSKGHLKPKKADGPGPGSYELPSGLKTYQGSDTYNEKKKTTWGTADREG